MNTEPVTVVVFRKFRNGGDVIALFPYLPGTNDLSTCSSYQHIGQHGSADYSGCMRASVPATPEEYASLKHELEGAPFGYRLQVQLTAHATRRRREAAIEAMDKRARA